MDACSRYRISVKSDPCRLEGSLDVEEPSLSNTGCKDPGTVTTLLKSDFVNKSLLKAHHFLLKSSAHFVQKSPLATVRTSIAIAS